VHYRQDSTIDPDSLIVVRAWAPQLRIAAVPNDSQASVFINYKFRSSFDMATPQNLDSLVSISVRSKAQKDSSVYKVRVLRANDARVVFDTLWVDRGIVSPTYNYTSGKYAYNVIVNRGDTTKLHFRFNDTLNSSAWSPASNGTAYRSVYPVHGGNDTSVSMVATSKGTAVYNVYTIGIYSGDDTRLKSLAVTGQRSGILMPAFNPDSTKYALTVNAFDTAVNIAGATRCGLAKAYLGVNSADSVTAQGIVHRLPARGSDVFDTVNVNVLGANGQTKGSYAIVIHRPLPSTIVALDTLTADSNFVTKVGPNSYVVKAVSKSLKLKAIPKDSLATVKIIDTTNARTVLTSISIDTNSKTKVYAVVTAQNGTDSAIDTITVLRGNDARAMLDSIWVDRGTFSPAFNYLSGNYKYSLFVNRNDLAAKLRFKINDTTKTVGWSPANNGKAYGSTYPLSVSNDTSVNMVVLGASNSLNLYAFNIYLRDEARLNALSITGQSSGTLAPVFNPDSLKYTMTVGAADSVAALVGRPKATYGKVSFNGDTAVMHSLTVPLKAGNDTLIVTSKAMDTTVAQTYRLIVTRPAALSNLGVSVRNPVSGTYTTAGFTKSFEGDSLNYTINGTIPFAADSIRFFPISNDSQNAIKIAGRAVRSKDSISVSVPPKGDIISDTVTLNSKDGKSISRYVVRFPRASSEKNTYLSGLMVIGSSPDTLPLVFDTSKTTFGPLSIPFQDTSITVKPSTGSALASVRPDSICVKPINGSAKFSSPATNLSGISLMKLGTNRLSIGDTLMAYFRVKAEDTTVLRSYIVSVIRHADTTKPVLIKFGTTKDMTVEFKTASIKVAWTATDNDSLVSVKIDSLATMDSANVYSATVPLTGARYVVVEATDRTGNVARDSVKVSIKSDTTKPTAVRNATTLSSSVPFDSSAVTVGWTVTDNDTLTSVMISGDAVLAATGGVYTHRSALSVGANLIQMVATDRSGNSDTDTVTITRLADTARPRITLDTIASQAWTIAASAQSRTVPFDSTKAVFSWIVTDNDKVASVTARSSSSMYSTALPAQAGRYLDTLSSLSLGENDIYLTATDPTGNVALDTVKITRLADTTKPVIARVISQDTVTSVPYATETISLAWTATDNDTVKTVTIAGVAATASGNVYTANVPLVPGINTLRLVVTDRAGNVSRDSVIVTRIDATKPTAKASTGATARTVVFDTSSASLAWIVKDNDKVATVTIGGVSATQSLDSIWTAKVPLAVGSDTIRMVGKDRAGNAVNDSVVITRTKDNTPPVAARAVTTKDTTIPYVASGYAVSWTVKDNDSTAPKVTMIRRTTAGDSTYTITASGSTYATTISAPAAKDSMWVILSAKDSTGNEMRDSVKVHRKGPSSVATLAAVATTTGTMSPAINATDISYTLTVDNTVDSVTLTPTVLDPMATTSTTKTIKLGDPGTTTMDSLIVTAQDGTVRKYHFSVVRSQAPLTLATSITSAVTLKTDSVYYISATTTVKSGGTLTIEPGARIEFDSGKTLVIVNGGMIIARGTKAKPITFTKYNTSNWGYLNLNGAASATFGLDGSYAGGSILENVVIEYSGNSKVSNNGALRITGCAPYLHNVTVSSSASNGVDVYVNDGVLMTVDTVTVSDNAGDGWYGTSTEYNDGSIFRGCRALRNKGNGFNKLGYGVVVSDCRAEGNGLNGFDSVGSSIQMFRDTAMNNYGWGIYGVGTNGGNSNIAATMIDSAYVYGNVGGLYSHQNNNGYNCAVVVKNSEFVGNASNAALYLVNDGSYNDNAHVINCKINNNVAPQVVYISGYSYYGGEFVGNQIAGNVAQTTTDNGIYFYCAGNTSYQVHRNRFEGNTFKGQGIYFNNQSDSADTVIGNSAVGNVVYSQSSTTLHDIFYGNLSTGGEILMLQNSTVTGNLFDSNTVSVGHGVVGQSTACCGTSSFTGNNFMNNTTTYMLRNYLTNTSYGVAATSNYWQAGDEDVVLRSLYPSSENVDGSVGGIIYSPYSFEPTNNPGTPTWH